jgi:hypothetical protein
MRRNASLLLEHVGLSFEPRHLFRTPWSAQGVCVLKSDGSRYVPHFASEPLSYVYHGLNASTLNPQTDITKLYSVLNKTANVKLAYAGLVCGGRFSAEQTSLSTVDYNIS